MGQVIKQAIGYGKNWQITAKDSTGAVVTQYTNSNALSASVWTGQNQTSIINPVVTWINPALGLIQLAISAANMNALTVGGYALQVWVVDNGGQHRLIFDGGLEATPSPGSASGPSSDISYYDLTLYAPQIRSLQDQKSDLAGFLNERHEAQAWFQNQVLNRYRPQAGRSRRYMNAAGNAAGTLLIYAPSPTSSWDVPSLANLATYFAAGGLVVGEYIRQCEAHYAASVIYLGQPGRDNVYQQAGDKHRSMAVALFDQCVVELDTGSPPTSPPSSIIRVDRDVTYLT